MNEIIPTRPSGDGYTDEELAEMYKPKISPGETGYKRGVVKANAELATTIMNPKTYYDMGKGYEEGKGLVLPGRLYIGPGNKLPSEMTEEWLPKSRGDYLAYLHDQEYGGYLKKGYTPGEVYSGFSEADQKLMDEAKKDLTDVDSLAALYGMGVKKGVSKLGLTPTYVK